jgi:uncharacterized Zn finger protein
MPRLVRTLSYREEGAVPDQPMLEEAAIRERVGETSFARGAEYFRSGAIFNPRRQGATLKAQCTGSSAPFYRVEATLDDGEIADANCSCPVGGGGFCKHVAALLLTWNDRPQDFVEVESFDTALERRSKAELIALIKQMLAQQPDLEALLETTLAPAGGQRPPVNVETYRRQAAAAFRGGGFEDWGAASAAAEQLRPLVLVGNSLLEQGDARGAAAVYEVIAGTVQENYETVDDESGDLAAVVQDSLMGLGRCLATLQDAGPREDILRVLFEVYHGDVDAGGYGMSDEVPALILEAATPQERRLVAGWVHAALPQEEDWHSAYTGKEYGRFLLALGEGTLDDEAYLQICRDAGLDQELVERLLSLGRLEEATAELQEAQDRALLALADLFVRHGQAETAERVVAAHAATTPPAAGAVAALEWLKKRADARNDLPAAFDLQQRIFQQRPNLSGYLELRRLAQQLGRWADMRPSLLAGSDTPGGHRLLIEIRLADGEIDAALEALATASPGVAAELALQVAQAAEAARPAAALDIYRRRAEALIAQRGRDNYVAAARLLQKVRDLHGRLDDAGGWTSYLTDLRNSTRSLRALKEELAAAGLT